MWSFCGFHHLIPLLKLFMSNSIYSYCCCCFFHYHCQCKDKNLLVFVSFLRTCSETSILGMCVRVHVKFFRMNASIISVHFIFTCPLKVSRRNFIQFDNNELIGLLYVQINCGHVSLHKGSVFFSDLRLDSDFYVFLLV